MKKAALIAFAPGIALAAACSTAPPPEVIAAEGCLTASEDQLILTELEPAGPHPGLEHGNQGETPVTTTEAYLLEGDTEELRGLVGRQVRVRGEADPAEVAEIRLVTPTAREQVPDRAQSRPTEPLGTSGDAEAAPEAEQTEPLVTAEPHIRFEIHPMRVLSAVATGESCQEGIANR